MQVQNRICPQCSQPLVYNEMYCRNCHGYYPEPAGNTNTEFPAPPDYLGTSSQNWRYPAVMQEGEKIDVTTYPQRSPRRLNVRLIAVFSAILLVALLLGGAYALGKSSNNTSPTNESTFLSTTTTASSPATAATSSPTIPATPTTIATLSTTPTVDTGPNLLYRADFNKGWTMAGFKVNPDNSIVCDGTTQASAVTSFVAPQDYTVKMTVQYLGNPGSLWVHGRVNEQNPQGVIFEYNGSTILGGDSKYLENANIDPNAPFTVTVTYKGGNITVVIGQAGTNSVATDTTSSLETGTTSITVDRYVSVQVSNFQIYSA